MAPFNRPGTLSTRVRKNAKNLTSTEWARFIAALKALKTRTRPGGVISIYDEFCALHMGAVEINRNWRHTHAAGGASATRAAPADPAHDNPGFLPWHRQLLAEFEAALQAVDVSVTLPYWDWTDHEFTKKLLSPAIMGGTGGHNGIGGALVDGPFTLQQGWVVNTALHRPSWYMPMVETKDEDEREKDSDEARNVQRPSLGRSVVRYLGDVEELANHTDVLNVIKRKATFGPDKLVVRSDNVQPVPDEGNEPEELCKEDFPRGTFHIGDSLPASVWASLLDQQDQNCSIGSFDACDVTDVVETIPLRIRENIPGFRASLEVGPRMHSQTHDWFGNHTTILQDDQLEGASTMANIGCATVDPIFFLHHCNVDRLWAEWQDSGHYGTIFYPKREDPLCLYADTDAVARGEPMQRYGYPDGHNLDDKMWPWNDDEIQTEPDLQEMIPHFSYTVSPRDVLDYRLMGYSYDTSTALTVNNVAPIIVHLPASKNKITHQVFPLDIQRGARYLIGAKEAGVDHVHLDIQVYQNYEEGFEHAFIRGGFANESIPPEPQYYKTKTRTSRVWKLQRGRYFVVVSAVVRCARDESAVEAAYEIGVASSLDFELPAVPNALGVIADPQVPQESCMYVANRRYAPVKLEVGKPQYRLTQMKGTHELFGIIVESSVGMLDVRFEGMDGLVQLYGPFTLESDHLPHFDQDGKPIDGDTDTRLDSRRHIATSEGCCKHQGSGVSSIVTPGRYIIIAFHCSIGHREHQPYKVIYKFHAKQQIRELTLGLTSVVEGRAGRAVSELYAVCGENGQPLVTQDGDVFEVDVATEDAATQQQVRVAMFAYLRADILRAPEDMDSGRHVAHVDAFWGGSKVTGIVSGDQVLFVRVKSQHGKKVATSIRRRRLAR